MQKYPIPNCQFLQCPKQPLLNQLYFQKYFWCSQVWESRWHFAMPTLVLLWNDVQVNQHGNFILVTRRYPDLCGASNWLCCVRNLLQPIQSTTSYFISVYTPRKIALYYCVLLQSSASVCQQVQHPVFIESQYSSLTSTFFKRLPKCLSCFVLICASGALEGVVILFYSF